MTHTEAATMQLSSEGAVGVPLKFVLVRGRRVVEQRRTRLLCPSLEDVKGCVRQWACGVFTLRYVDDEGDLVTVDLDEEWAECVALWREARGADDADVCAQQRALRLVVTIGAQDGSAVCLGQQRDLREAFWERVRHHRDAQRDGHRHHQHMHGRHGAMPGIRHLLAEWQAHAQTQGQEQKQAGDEVESGSESVKEVTPCCRRSVKQAGEHGPRCRVHGKKSADATDVLVEQTEEKTPAEAVSEEVKPCCRRSVKHAGQHGPRCRVHSQTPEEVEALLSVQEGAPCCRRSAKHAGKHGPHCRVHKRKSDATEAVEVPSQEEEEDVTAGVSDAALLVCAGCSFEVTGVHATHCCVRCAKHAGQHGPRCEQKMPMAAEEDVQVEDDEDVVVVAVPAETEAEPERVEEKQEADSAGVTALRNMGFDITADVRAVLERHNGDVAAVLEEMM